jgi:hypothetical protein
MKHKSLQILLILVCVFAASQAFGQGPLGLGVIFGDPSGISAKYWLNSRDAIDGVLGVGLWHYGYLTLSADWVRHWSNFTPVRSGRFLLGAGGGPVVSIGSDPALGVRIKGLADYTFAEAPVNLFFELGPTIMIVAPGVGVAAGLGVRWFFK